ncbi:MAG: hypothetical protein FH761_17775 [Firmicutes bacterium]|nr:hypothetical protein [Bacillota bacterium]
MDAREAIEDIKNNIQPVVGGISLDMAIKALEKQIPKEPIKHYKVHGNTYAECPNCNHTGLRQSTHDHCWWCGQRLDWIGYLRTEDLAKEGEC